MATNITIIEQDTSIKGKIRDCEHIEIRGYIEGDLVADTVLIHEGGRFYGKLESQSVVVHGTIQGNVKVKELMDIRSSAEVNGNIRYGRLSCGNWRYLKR